LKYNTKVENDTSTKHKSDTTAYKIWKIRGH